MRQIELLHLFGRSDSTVMCVVEKEAILTAALEAVSANAAH